MKTLKILAVGNSFSVDGMRYLYDVAKAEGVDLLLGNLYIGGCSLERHFSNTLTGARDYTYYKNADGEWRERGGCAISDGLLDEEWEVITTQQCSGLSGLPESYQPYLDGLVAYLCENAPKKDFRLGWQMTWAYSRDSDHPEFPNYDRDQDKMYRSICGAVKKVVLPRGDYDMIIPTGSAIQSARQTLIGDNLNRDGFHLNRLGRYIASMTWFRAITGEEVTSPAIPEDVGPLSGEVIRAALDSANRAPEVFRTDIAGV